jgi:GxxExxY protein
MHADEKRINVLTEKVLGAEKVYQRALLKELSLRGIRATPEVSFSVTDKGHTVGEYFADLLVADVLVVELKCVDRLGNEHMAQCLNYLKASRLSVCLLVNFQRPKVEWKRVIMESQPRFASNLL